MLMRKFLNRAAYILLILFISVSLSSCHDDDPAPKPEKDPEKVILLYAISSNDLYQNLVDDLNEILAGMANAGENDTKFLVYSVTPEGSAMLERIEKNKSGAYVFKKVRSYDKKLLSTHPKRISQVISDVREMHHADRYGLIFWSHSSAWLPGSTPHDVAAAPGQPDRIDDQMLFWFGLDQTTDTNDFTDIHELADAVPDGVFDFIWFDSCYMGNIESAFQFRNKCRYYVGYPTEIYASGSPYDQTIPYLVKKGESDLVGAAKVLFDSFNDRRRAVTVAILDMNHAEEMAEAASRILANYQVVGSSGMMNYGRGSNGPFYDLGQFLNKAAAKIGFSDMSEIDRALSRFVVYKAASAYNFNNQPIDAQAYSGLSTHLYKNQSNDRENYYRTLDWFAKTYNRNK